MAEQYNINNLTLDFVISHNKTTCAVPFCTSPMYQDAIETVYSKQARQATSTKFQIIILYFY